MMQFWTRLDWSTNEWANSSPLLKSTSMVMLKTLLSRSCFLGNVIFSTFFSNVHICYIYSVMFNHLNFGCLLVMSIFTKSFFSCHFATWVMSIFTLTSFQAISHLFMAANCIIVLARLLMVSNLRSAKLRYWLVNYLHLFVLDTFLIKLFKFLQF